MGGGAMSAASFDVNLELVHRRHERSAVDPHAADGELVPQVEADGRVHSVQDAVRDARARSAARLLGGLKDEAYGAGASIERPAGGDRERDRDVAVVAARVHPSRSLRLELDAARLGQREGVHVRAHEKTLPAGPEIGRDTGPAHAVSGRESQPPELVGNYRGGAGLFERGFRVTVQVALHLNDGVELVRGEVGQDLLNWVRLVTHVRILQKRRAECGRPIADSFFP